MRIKITVSYDGTDFVGWQVQNTGVSVQGLLEDALYAVTGERRRITGSGRTDAGVHALGQVAHFDTDSGIPAEKFCRALNAHLPDNVRVLDSACAEENFHACSTAKRKTYVYKIYLSDMILPLKDRYAVKVYGELDMENINACAKELVGEHDFKGFSSTGGSVKTSVRKIYSLDVTREGDDVTFSVCGNGFLYNMVRIIVGTLIKAGKGELTPTDMRKMLTTGDRTIGGETLPAKGLCLKSVEYE